MKHELLCLHASVLIFTILGVFAVYAEENPVVLKRGGIPYENMWKEEEVNAYLRLPRFASTDGKVGFSMEEVSKRIESAQSLAGYQPVKKTNDLFRLRSSQIPVASLELRGADRPDLHVSVYDYRAWNILCDKLFEYITVSFSLWNIIPEAYAVEADENVYVLARTGGKVQKWYFSLKGIYVIGIHAEPVQKSLISEENVMSEVDKMIQELVGLIEGTD